MDEETAQALQTTVGVLGVSVIAIAGLAAGNSGPNELLVITGSAFTLIAAILGVHVGIRAARNGK